MSQKLPRVTSVELVRALGPAEAALREYTILITLEGDAYIVDVPALPGCHTYGTTPDEALANAREAIEAYLEDLRASGEPIPGEQAEPRLVKIQVAA